MSPDIKVTPDPAKRDAFLSRRAQRYDAQRILWAESTLTRVRNCQRVCAAGAESVRLRVSGPVGARSAGFGGLQSCGSVWACPVCATKIAATRQAELSAALRQWQKLGHGVILVTLTMRHRKGQRLSSLWDAVSYAWNAASSGRAWADVQKLHGVPFTRTIKTGDRAGEQVTSTRMPTVRVVEVTHGKNGWHVHVHALVFVARDVMDATADELGRSMFTRWSDALVRKGMRAPDRENGGLEAHAGTGDLHVFADYFTKAQYNADGLAAEATRGDLKKGKRANRTPFQLLESVYTTGDLADLEAWHEWERGSKGRRQLTWTPGLRELVQLPAVELSDEEVVDLEHGGETLADIETASYLRQVASVRHRVVQLLEAAESDLSGQAAWRLLDRWGVDYTVPAVTIGVRQALRSSA